MTDDERERLDGILLYLSMNRKERRRLRLSPRAAKQLEPLLEIKKWASAEEIEEMVRPFIEAAAVGRAGVA